MELSKIIDGMLLLIDGILTIGRFHIYNYIYISIYIYIYLNLKQNEKDFCVDKSGTIMFARTRNTRIKRKRISSSHKRVKTYILFANNLV